MRDQSDDFNDLDYAKQEVYKIVSNFEGVQRDRDPAEVIQFYHAEQVRNVAEQLSRIADAMEESE